MATSLSSCSDEDGPWTLVGAWKTKHILGSKNTSALMHASSESSICISFMALTSSSMMRAPMREMSRFGDMFASGHCLVMMQLFPSSSMSCRCIDRRDSPSSRCSPACARSSATWSSSCSSAKAGIDLAHSTSISSCCFIESHTSLMLANRFDDRSASSASFVSSSAAPKWRLKFSARSRNFTDSPLMVFLSSVLGLRQLMRSRSSLYSIPALDILVVAAYWLASSGTHSVRGKNCIIMPGRDGDYYHRHRTRECGDGSTVRSAHDRLRPS
uniref:Uncharacterized protein n=1 Tax=Anopheles melas TaxID=34690 RepID=A0A182TRC0_9DIPT